MDVLKNKKYRKSDALSRYSPFPYYYNEVDEKYVYGVTSWLGQNIPYVSHKVQPGDTLGSLALKYYGRPDYYWIIADFNRIEDALSSLYNEWESVAVPSLNDISFERIR